MEAKNEMVDFLKTDITERVLLNKSINKIRL